jgi:predicted DNA-binding antitoxin AbrB/MazE fold protein
MTIVVEATYQNGILKPKEPLTLAEGTEVRLTITPAGESYDPLEAVIGICDEGPDFSLAARHNEVIYGPNPTAERRP